MLEEFNGPFERALEKAEDSFERYQEELDELCPLCPTEGREPGKLQVKLGRYGKFIGCPNYPECRYIRNMDGTERAEPELLDETVPRVRQAAPAPGRSLRPVRRMQRLPGLPLHQEGPADVDRRHRARSATRARSSRSARGSGRSTGAIGTPSATSR